jgi:hypothetical protein
MARRGDPHADACFPLAMTREARKSDTSYLLEPKWRHTYIYNTQAVLYNMTHYGKKRGNAIYISPDIYMNMAMLYIYQKDIYIDMAIPKKRYYASTDRRGINAAYACRGEPDTPTQHHPTAHYTHSFPCPLSHLHNCFARQWEGEMPVGRSIPPTLPLML